MRIAARIRVFTIGWPAGFWGRSASDRRFGAKRFDRIGNGFPGRCRARGQDARDERVGGEQANLQALAAGRAPVLQPRHRLPNGGLTSAPSRQMLEALPQFAQPNAATQGATATPSFASINGFVGIYEGNNVTANGYELEPPDQGLAVNNNVAVEIVNNVLRSSMRRRAPR